MLMRDLFAAANLLVFFQEIGRSSSGFHTNALFILDSEYVFADF